MIGCICSCVVTEELFHIELFVLDLFYRVHWFATGCVCLMSLLQKHLMVYIGQMGLISMSPVNVQFCSTHRFYRLICRHVQFSKYDFGSVLK